MSDAPQAPGWWQASDGRWYPPDYGPPGYPRGGYGSGYPSMPPPSRSRGRNGCLVALLVVLALAVLGGIGSCVALAAVADDVADDVSEDLAEEQSDEADDVSEPRCEQGPAGEMRAVMTVTNDSSERSNYGIDVVFDGPDQNQLGTGHASVRALGPGQSTEAVATSVDAAPGEFTCEVADVERFSDEG